MGNCNSHFLLIAVICTSLSGGHNHSDPHDHLVTTRDNLMSEKWNVCLRLDTTVTGMDDCQKQENSFSLWILRQGRTKKRSFGLVRKNTSCHRTLSSAYSVINKSEKLEKTPNQNGIITKSEDYYPGPKLLIGSGNGWDVILWQWDLGWIMREGGLLILDNCVWNSVSTIEYEKY